jgi:hypothetical protein
MIRAGSPREIVTRTTSRRNLRTVEKEAWQAPLREAINVVSDGPTRPPRSIPGGSGASSIF